MGNAPVIVLGTGDIMTKEPSCEGQAPVFAGKIDLYAEERAALDGVAASAQTRTFVGGALEPVHAVRYSTGRLEHALHLTRDVYVVSLKSGPGPHDEWWMQLLAADHVFFYEELGEPIRRHDVGPGAVRPYERLYRALGFPWNSEWTRVTRVREDLAARGVTFADGIPVARVVS